MLPLNIPFKKRGTTIPRTKQKDPPTKSFPNEVCGVGGEEVPGRSKGGDPELKGVRKGDPTTGGERWGLLVSVGKQGGLEPPEYILGKK